MRRWMRLACGIIGPTAVLALLIWATPARAAGIWLYEMATPDQGTAVAGRAALGADASTAWGNPAGMTRLDESQLLVGAGPLVLQSQFNVSPGTTQSGGGSNLTMGLPEGSAYYVQHFDGALKNLRLGVALTTLPGLSGDYGKT